MPETKFPWRVAACATLASLAALAWWQNPRGVLEGLVPEPRSAAAIASEQALSGSPAATPGKSGVDASIAAIHPPAKQPPAHPQDRSPLADDLHQPAAPPQGDVEMVFNLLEHYRERFGGLPTAEDNAQVVNALTGNNPQRIALLPRDHPAISPDGELLDRWGAPYAFHFISRDHLEIRSAGPDGKLYTSDDLLKASPALTAAPTPQPADEN
jgi:hypothetical protein